MSDEPDELEDELAQLISKWRGQGNPAEVMVQTITNEHANELEAVLVKHTDD